MNPQACSQFHRLIQLHNGSWIDSSSIRRIEASLFNGTPVLSVYIVDEKSPLSWAFPTIEEAREARDRIAQQANLIFMRSDDQPA